MGSATRLRAASPRSSSRTSCSEAGGGSSSSARVRTLSGNRGVNQRIEGLVAEDLEHSGLLLARGPDVAVDEVLDGLEDVGSGVWTLFAHGGLLTRSAIHAELVGRPPRSVIGPESLAAL